MAILQVITVSTREGRQGPLVADWFVEFAKREGSFDVRHTDLADLNLPLFDEPAHPRLKQYKHEHTRRWSAVVEEADAFVFVTPEYNFGAPPSLINAIDYLALEWAYKPAGFVSYGGVSGGLRAVQMAKSTLSTMKIVPIPEAVTIPFFSKFLDESGSFVADEVQEKSAAAMLVELARWSGALKTLRS